MITYFIKSGLCLALLLAFYHLVLEREKMHKFNRFYLLGSVLFSFLAPLYVIYEYVPVITESFAPILIDNEFVPEQIIVEEPFNYTLYLIGLYVSISLLLFIRFCKNLFLIIQKIRKNRHIKLENATIVLVEDTISPHTFLNYIFINTDEYFSEKIENELLTHELTHVTQKHTIDILLIEFLQVLFWINPIFILLKKAVKLNHEFLADNKVVNTYKNITEYQYLLLNRATWNNEYYLASNLNYLLTKKRLQMMTKQSSRTKILLKKLAVIPLLVGFMFLFAERVTAQEKADPKIVAEYNKLAKKYNNQPDDKRFIKLKEVQRMEALYAKLNDAQKLKAEKYPDLPPPPPPVVKNGKAVRGNFVPPPPPPPPFQNKNSKRQTSDFNSDGKFSISVEKEKDLLRLRCYDCRWANLKLDLNKKFIINDFGFSNGKTLDRDIFAFEIEASKNSVTLKSLKGTTWRSLRFDLTKAKKYYLNQKGSVKVGKKPVRKQQKTTPESSSNTPEKGWVYHNNATYFYFIENGKTTYYDRNGKIVDLKLSSPFTNKAKNTKKMKFVKKGSLQNVGPIEKVMNFIETISDEVQQKKPKTGWIYVNNQTIYYKKHEDKTTYYNRFGYLVDKNGNKIQPEKRAKSNEVLPNQNITKVYKNDRLTTEFQQAKDSIIDYYVDGKKMSKEEALSILPKDIKRISVIKKTTPPRIEMYTKTDSITPNKGLEQVGKKVYAYKIINGKKQYFDEKSGKPVSVKHPEPEDYDEMMKRIKKTKKICYIENKRVSEKEFKNTVKNDKAYNLFMISKKNDKNTVVMIASKKDIDKEYLLKKYR